MSDITTLMMAASGAGGAEETDPNFNQTVLLLHGDGTNGAQNNTFLDSSSNTFTITRNGNTTQGTFSPFSGPDGYWSNFFDGTNDRLTIADNAALRPGTSAFTIEAWVYRAAAGAAHTIFAKGASTPTGFAFLITSSNTLRFTDTSTDITSTGTVAANTWVHVAAVREGTGSNQLKLYINGVQDGTGTSSTNFTQTEEARIGENRGATDDFNGYISNFRYVIGTALYTSGFTPSTSPLTTTSQGATSSQVELLTCQSNRFLDNSTNGFTISPVNNTSVQPFSPFAPSAAYSASVNGGSGYFDGNGDSLTIPASADFAFGTGDFTIEFWGYFSSIDASDTIYIHGNTNATVQLFFVNGKLRYNNNGVASVLDTTTTIPTNQWMHFAIVRSSGTAKWYLNGVEDASTSDTTNWSSSATDLTIGRDPLQSGRDITGYLANLRVVKGTAVYTAAFTPPTAPLTAVTNTKLLLNFTNAGIFDNTGKNNLETVADAQIDTTTKKYGTGSMEFDGTGDYLKISSSLENYAFGSGDFTIEIWGYLNNLSDNRQFYESYTGDGSGRLSIYVDTSGVVQVRGSGGATKTSGGTVSTSTWTHIAITRASGSMRIFLDGVQVNTTYTDTAVYTATEPILIGVNGFQVPNYWLWNGYIDDLRITKGVARYTANFTPPTAPFLDQ